MTRQAITTHMDEPVEPGLYLISTESGEIVYSTFHAESFDDGSMWLDSFGDGVPWDDFAEYYADSGEMFYIQSLAAHDAQIRAEAWDEGRKAESAYWNYLSEAGGDTEPTIEPEEPTNPYRVVDEEETRR